MAVALLGPTVPAVTHAGVPLLDFTYPGGPGCEGTLQACINSVPSGSTIRIATNERIDPTSGLTIEKDLTLRPATGFDPVIGSGDPVTPRTIRVEDSGGVPVDVTIRDLRLEAARIDVRFFSHSGSRFTALANTVRHRAQGNNDQAIAVDVRVDDAVVVIEGNLLNTTGAPLRVLSLLSSNEDEARFRLIGNRISAPVRQDAYHGIDLDVRGSGEVRLDVLANTIRKAMGCNCGGSGALSLLVLDEPTVVANLVGNTIDRSEGSFSGIGIILDIRATGGVTTARIFNNVVSNGSGGAFWFPNATPRLKVEFGANAVYENRRDSRWGGYRPAQLPRTLAPGYVDGKAGDYRLTSASRLRDQGQVCSPGGTARIDAAGRFRVAGANVDIGAHEHAAPKAGKGVVRLGTDGPDTLVGTNGRDILCGFDGADILTGGPKPDVHVGGRGADQIRADDGTPGDLVIGGTGRDRCRFDPGDRVSGCP
jgi:Ca2+-binding RTX toxin-like protein